MKIQKSLFLLLFFAVSCTKNDIPTCVDDVALFSLADFPIGVAVSPFELESNSAYRQIVVEQFNRITPGNAFKPDALQPLENNFSFEIADSLVAFANANGKQIHGHTLLWHNQLPSWMNSFSGNRDEWILMMETHIKTVVTHFGNQVKSWDVVNEAFEDNGDFRENIWYQNIGEAYLKLAFELAHEANPDAILFYNDFNIAAKTKKCEAILNHFKKLKNEGVPVHGIGLQLHVFNATPSEDKIKNAVKAIANEGFQIHFSEIDISMNLSGGNMKLTDNKLQKQGERMKLLTDIFQTIPENQQFGMTIWGVSDLDSWIPSFFDREDYPLLYDENYKPKPMYCGFLEGLMER